MRRVENAIAIALAFMFSKNIDEKSHEIPHVWFSIRLSLNKSTYGRLENEHNTKQASRGSSTENRLVMISSGYSRNTQKERKYQKLLGLNNATSLKP